jgi:hypothetical protein
VFEKENKKTLPSLESGLMDITHFRKHILFIDGITHELVI